MTQKPQTFTADIAHLPKPLEFLIGENRWVIWRWELRIDKNGEETWTEVPYQPDFPKSHAHATNHTPGARIT